MSDLPNEKQRLEKMVRDNKLSQQEADRLFTVLKTQEERQEQYNRVAQLRHKGFTTKIRGWLLWLVTFFIFGLIAGSFFFYEAKKTPEGSSAGVIQQNQTTQNRPVDLSQLDQERRLTMTKGTRFGVAMIFIVIAAMLGSLSFFMFNSLVKGREGVNAGWAQVENAYQRRLDLVPLLIDAVKTYMQHERQTLETLTEARARAAGVLQGMQGTAPDDLEKLQSLESAQAGVQSALTRLFAVVENYPDLKASRNFLTLQDQIEGTENRIAMERRHFNEIVRHYNTRTMTFPSNLIATLFDFHQKPYFQAEAAAMKPIEDPFGSKE